MPDAPRTVTLPLVWRENKETGDHILLIGPLEAGMVFEARDGWLMEGQGSACHPPRAAAMAALEEAVCALGVKQDG